MSARPSAPVAWRKARACSGRDAGEFCVVEDDGLAEIGDAVAGAAGELGGRAQDVPLGFEHGARRIARERAADVVRRVRRSQAARGSRALNSARPCSLRISFASARSSCAGVKVERCLVIASSTAAGVARGDRVAQLVHVLAARRDDAAMLALVSLRPFRQRAPAAGEIVGAAGCGIDLRGDDVDVGIILVVVRDEDRLGVAMPRASRALRAASSICLAGRGFARIAMTARDARSPAGTGLSG